VTNFVYFGDNLPILESLPDASFDLIYIDPPFNTGKVQLRRSLKTTRAEEGDRIGFAGQSYRTEVISEQRYNDILAIMKAF